MTPAHAHWMQILKEAQRSPTGDNCQPFRFSFRDDLLVVDLDRVRSRHEFDPRDISSHISLGLLWEHLKIAALNLLHKSVEPVSFPQQNGFFPMVFRLTESSERSPIPLSALAQRRVFRGRFRSEALSAPALLQAQELMLNQGAQLIWKGSDSFPKVVEYLVDADAYFWKTPTAIRDTFAWIRWTQGHYQKMQDGFTPEELGMRLTDRPPMWLFSKFPRLAGILHPFTRPLYDSFNRANLQSSLGFFLVDSPGVRYEDFVELGRSAARVWLQVTALGWGVQPWSYASYFAAYSNETSQSSNVPKDLSVLRSAFPKAKKIPWLFRFGILPARVPALSLRRPLEVTKS